MTNPIPGADIDRIEFFDKRTGIAIQPNESDTYFVMIDIVWRDTCQTCESQSAVVGFDDFIERCPNIGWRVDSAAKAGANVAADDTITITRTELVAYRNQAFAEGVIEGRDQSIAAGAPAETPKPVLPRCDVIEMLLDVARAAFDAMDSTEEDDKGLHWHRGSFDDLSGAMDKLDALPDDKPGYVMGPAAKAGWALQQAAQPYPAPIAGDVEKDAAMLDLLDTAHVCSWFGLGRKILSDTRTGRVYSGETWREAIRAAMLANSSSGEAG